MLDTPGGGVTPLKKESGPAGHDRRPWPPPRALPFPAVFALRQHAKTAPPYRYPPPPHGKESAHRRVARQGEDDQQIPRQGLHRPGLLRPRARPGPEGGRGRPGQRVRDALRPDREEREARRCDRQGRQERRRPVPRDRPGPRRRGDQLAHRGDPPGARPAEGQGAAPRRVHRDHAARDPRSDDATAFHRRPARRRATGAPRAGLPRRLQPLARAVAQGAARFVFLWSRRISSLSNHLAR